MNEYRLIFPPGINEFPAFFFFIFIFILRIASRTKPPKIISRKFSSSHRYSRESTDGKCVSDFCFFNFLFLHFSVRRFVFFIQVSSLPKPFRDRNFIDAGQSSHRGRKILIWIIWINDVLTSTLKI